MGDNDEFENIYYLAGDTEESKIAIPYNWTLSDALFLKRLLIERFQVGAMILYGNKNGTSKII